MSVGISHLAYRLPPHSSSLEELEAAAKLSSSVSLLREFGFERCYAMPEPASLEEMVIDTGQDLLEAAGILTDEIAMLFWVSGLSAEEQCRDDGLLSLFRYPVARAHYELGLTRASALSVSQQGCSGLLSTIDMAARLLNSSDASAAVCLAGDALPSEHGREIMYNLMSDAAAAVLLERGSPRNTIVAFRQHTQSYYWDTPTREQELLAAYFPIAQRLIIACLEQARIELSSVRWFVPHNVSQRSWQILARLLGIEEERVWTRNISRLGHTVSCDHVINLADMAAEGVLSPGDYLVLFTFGFGASWSCMVLEH